MPPKTPRRQKAKHAIPREPKKQHAVRQRKGRFEYSTDLVNWFPERRELKRGVRSQLKNTRVKMGASSDLYAGRGFQKRGRKKGKGK